MRASGGGGVACSAFVPGPLLCAQPRQHSCCQQSPACSLQPSSTSPHCPSRTQAMADAAAEGFGPAASQTLAAALAASLDLATRLSVVLASAGSSAAPDDADALASALAQASRPRLWIGLAVVVAACDVCPLTLAFSHCRAGCCRRSHPGSPHGCGSCRLHVFDDGRAVRRRFRGGACCQRGLGCPVRSSEGGSGGRVLSDVASCIVRLPIMLLRALCGSQSCRHA